MGMVTDVTYIVDSDQMRDAADAGDRKIDQLEIIADRLLEATKNLKGAGAQENMEIAQKLKDIVVNDAKLFRKYPNFLRNGANAIDNYLETTSRKVQNTYIREERM